MSQNDVRLMLAQQDASDKALRVSASSVSASGMPILCLELEEAQYAGIYLYIAAIN